MARRAPEAVNIGEIAQTGAGAVRAARVSQYQHALFGSRCTLWTLSPKAAILIPTITMAALLMPLHIAPYTERFAAAGDLALPWFFTRVGICVYLQ
jgi:hypothetical protein